MQENNTQAAIDAGKAIVTAEQTVKYHGDLPFIIKPDGSVTPGHAHRLATLEQRERQAFEAIAKRIADATTLPLFYGQPEQ